MGPCTSLRGIGRTAVVDCGKQHLSTTLGMSAGLPSSWCILCFPVALLGWQPCHPHCAFSSRNNVCDVLLCSDLCYRVGSPANPTVSMLAKADVLIPPRQWMTKRPLSVSDRVGCFILDPLSGVLGIKEKLWADKAWDTDQVASLVHNLEATFATPFTVIIYTLDSMSGMKAALAQHGCLKSWVVAPFIMANVSP